MHIFPITFSGPQHLAKELQLNSVDPSVHISTPEDNFAITQGSKPRILAADYRPAGICTVADNGAYGMFRFQVSQLESIFLKLFP